MEDECSQPLHQKESVKPKNPWFNVQPRDCIGIATAMLTGTPLITPELYKMQMFRKSIQISERREKEKSEKEASKVLYESQPESHLTSLTITEPPAELNASPARDDSWKPLESVSLKANQGSHGEESLGDDEPGHEVEINQIDKPSFLSLELDRIKQASNFVVIRGLQKLLLSRWWESFLSESDTKVEPNIDNEKEGSVARIVKRVK